jgi:hypothetical protein
MSGSRPILVRAARAAGTGSLALMLTVLTGCYRAVSPVDPGEVVRVEVVVEDTRLVREQLYLLNEISREIQQGLGWRVGPQGSAVLRVVITGDRVRPSSTGSIGVTTRWQIGVLTEAVFTSAVSGRINTTITGNANASRLSEEDDALERVAEDIANGVRAWLDGASQDWPQDAPAASEPAAR